MATGSASRPEEVDLQVDDFVEELFAGLQKPQQTSQESQQTSQEIKEDEGQLQAEPAVMVVDSDSGGEGILVQAPAEVKASAKKKVQYSLATFFTGKKEPAVLVKKDLKEQEDKLEQLVVAEQARSVVQGMDGSRAGKLGGRPVVLMQDKRGIYGMEDLSNRLYPGQKRRREDQDPGEGLQMIQFMRSKRIEYACEADFWRAMVRRYRPKTKHILEAMLEKEEVFKEQTQAAGS